MYYVIDAGTLDDNGHETHDDAHFTAPDGQVEIILVGPGITVTFDAKELIKAIQNSLLDELGLL